MSALQVEVGVRDGDGLCRDGTRVVRSPTRPDLIASETGAGVDDERGFITYFDDDYWRLVQSSCASPAALAQELAFLDQLFREHQVSRVLDLCCGRGRHIVPLARSGLRVTGVELSERSLAFATESIKEEGLGACLVGGDIRTVDVGDGYDAAIFMQTSFGYHSDDENEAILELVGRRLRRGGLLILDQPNRDDIVANFRFRDWAHIDPTYYIISHQFDYRDSVRVTQLVAVDGEGRREYCHRLRLYSLPELTSMLERVGLRVIEVRGDFTDPQTRFRRDFRRLQLIAVR